MRTIVKKATHPQKQVTANEGSGLFVNVAASVPGPIADIKLLESSGFLKRLPAGVGPPVT